MKIAIAMLCHKNVKQINMLLEAMENDNFFFYIHVDKKSNIERDKILGKNICVLSEEKSVDVQWGGFGMIEATLHLVKEIQDSQQVYDSIWLISGQDFPVRSSGEILSYLEEHRNDDFIEILPQDEAFRRGYFKRNELFYPKWMVLNNVWAKAIKHIFWFATGGKRVTRIKKRKSNIKTFYYGSQWWILSKKSIELMMKYLYDNEWYINYFKNSLVPDESFFQTLYSMLIGVEKANPTICYVNWGKNQNSPEIITYKDLTMLREIRKTFLIARKFDFEVDSKIVMCMKKMVEEGHD